MIPCVPHFETEVPRDAQNDLGIIADQPPEIRSRDETYDRRLECFRRSFVLRAFHCCTQSQHLSRIANPADNFLALDRCRVELHAAHTDDTNVALRLPLNKDRCTARVKTRSSNLVPQPQRLV